MASVPARMLVVTDLLLGAAYADDFLEGREEETVRRLLGEILGEKKLPTELDARIRGFAPKKFDLEASVREFEKDPPVQKRKLLELVVAVHDADDELDLDEDEYVRTLAKALGMKPAEYSDLTLEVEIEELRDSLQTVTTAKK